MNQVIEVSEVGINDGKQMTVPVGESCFYMFESDGKAPTAPVYRVKYGDSGRKNARGFPIYERMERVLKET